MSIKIPVFKNKEEFKEWRNEYLWPNSKCNKPKKYPCTITVFEQCDTTEYTIEYIYIKDVENLLKQFQEAQL